MTLKNTFFGKWPTASTPETQDSNNSLDDDCSSTSNEAKDLDQTKPHVKFHQITIREYNRTLGDNPSVSAGPPIALDWEYNPESEILTIEDYEAQKPQRRRNVELVVPRNLREKLLKFECGFSRRQIAQSVRSVQAVKQNRRQTVNNLHSSKTQEKLENFKRALGRVVGIRKSSEREIEILWEKAGGELHKNNKKNAARALSPRNSRNVVQ